MLFLDTLRCRGWSPFIALGDMNIAEPQDSLWGNELVLFFHVKVPVSLCYVYQGRYLPIFFLPQHYKRNESSFIIYNFPPAPRVIYGRFWMASLWHSPRAYGIEAYWRKIIDWLFNVIPLTPRKWMQKVSSVGKVSTASFMEDYHVSLLPPS